MRRKHFIKLVYFLVVLALLLAWRPFLHLHKDRVFVRNEQSRKSEDLIQPDGPAGKLGYVVTIKFTGQQVAGIRGLFSQQCWLKLFNLPMSIVEPFVSDSILSHSKRLWDSQETGIAKPHFSNFYQASRVATDLKMTSWKSFLRDAPRKLVILTIENVFAETCLIFSKISCARKRPIPQQMNCSRTREMANAVAYLQAKGFQVVRTVCLNCGNNKLNRASPRDITEYIFQGHKPNDITLLMNRWKFSFRLTPDCVGGCPLKLDDMLPRPEVATYARKHLEYMKGKLGYEVKSVTTVGFMLRLEWFMISKTSKTLEELELCFARIQTAIDSIAHHTGKEVLLTLALDIGRYGSGTFNTTIRRNGFSPQHVSTIENKVKVFVSQIYKKKLNFEEWERTFDSVVGVIPDRGYIAAIQAQEAETADCLILMGGGHFQLFVREQFIKRNPTNKCLHDICMPSAFD